MDGEAQIYASLGEEGPLHLRHLGHSRIAGLKSLSIEYRLASVHYMSTATLSLQKTCFDMAIKLKSVGASTQS